MQPFEANDSFLFDDATKTNLPKEYTFTIPSSEKEEEGLLILGCYYND